MKKLIGTICAILMGIALIRATIQTGNININNILLDLQQLNIDYKTVNEFIKQMNPATEFQKTKESWGNPTNVIEWIKQINTTIVAAVKDLTNYIMNLTKVSVSLINFLINLVKNTIKVFFDIIGI